MGEWRGGWGWGRKGSFGVCVCGEDREKRSSRQQGRPVGGKRLEFEERSGGLGNVHPEDDRKQSGRHLLWWAGTVAPSQAARTEPAGHC